MMVLVYRKEKKIDKSTHRSVKDRKK